MQTYRHTDRTVIGDVCICGPMNKHSWWILVCNILLSHKPSIACTMRQTIMCCIVSQSLDQQVPYSQCAQICAQDRDIRIESLCLSVRVPSTSHGGRPTPYHAGQSIPRCQLRTTAQGHHVEMWAAAAHLDGGSSCRRDP